MSSLVRSQAHGDMTDLWLLVCYSSEWHRGSQPGSRRSIRTTVLFLSDVASHSDAASFHVASASAAADSISSSSWRLHPSRRKRLVWLVTADARVSNWPNQCHTQQPLYSN